MGHARALLVMNYCPGGDLFEVATKHREVLVPTLVRRIFSELVSATRYLHQKFVVHRDIKLESRCRKVRWSWSHADSFRRLAQHTRASSFRCRQLADARSSCCHSD